ncbi:hypothetical protein ACFLZN_00550 [Nanoarchaeota archaeon]
MKTVLLLIILILMVGCTMEIYPKKAKIMEKEDIEKGKFIILDYHLDMLPERGLAFFFIDYGNIGGGKLVVNFDKKEMEFTFTRYLDGKQGTVDITNKFNEIVGLANAMWAAENETIFEGPLPAKVQALTIVVSDNDEYRAFHFGGMLDKEALELKDLLIKIIEDAQ